MNGNPFKKGIAMIERKNVWTVATVVIVLVCSIVIYQLFHMPVPKTAINKYVMGTTIPTQASYYFDNVKANQVVKVVPEQFQKEGEHYVDVTLDGTVYKIRQKIEKPNIADIIKTTNIRETIVIGEDYAKFFHIDSELIDDITFSTPSANLTEGNTTLTMTAFGQSVTQELKVLSADSTEGKLTLSYDFSKELLEVINDYLEKQNIAQEKVAVVYRQLQSDKTVTINPTTTVLATETVEMPIAMLAEKQAKQGKIDNSVMKTLIDNMIRLSSTTAERTLLNTMGGSDAVYQQLSEFGTVSGVAPTVTQISGQTTAEYFGLVLSELYKNKDNYATTIDVLKQTSKNRYISRYLGDVPVWHRPSALGQVINDVAIVEAHHPYALALFTRDMTGNQFVELAYLINEWHKKH